MGSYMTMASHGMAWQGMAMTWNGNDMEMEWHGNGMPWNVLERHGIVMEMA
jgi:hypothetical protein